MGATNYVREMERLHRWMLGKSDRRIARCTVRFDRRELTFAATDDRESSFPTVLSRPHIRLDPLSPAKEFSQRINMAAI